MVAWAVGLVSLLLVVTLLLHGRAHKALPDQPATPQPDLAASSTAPQTTPPPPTVVANQPAPHVQPVSRQAEPTPAMRQLVGSLVNLDSSGGELTVEQAMTWKTNFQSLIQQGAEAVPAISEFLAKNVDFDFGSVGKQALGYSTARAAMFDALAQVGGPAGVGAMEQLLQNVADPKEIAVLAQDLEKLEPGLHQQQVLSAAREALGMAADGKLPNKDVAPLFEVLQQFGGANAVADLERSANQWNYYSMIALANLPDQAGVPALAQFAFGQGEAGSGKQVLALQMLGQLAPQSADARAALLDAVRQDKLTPSDWSGLAPVLAGRQMGYQNSAFGNNLDGVSQTDLTSVILPSNERYFTAPLGALTPEQISQRQALIDELERTTTDPVGVQALQRAKDLLQNRLLQLAATPGK
jgi:hypothetical protein